jgi:hypothetical protein
MAHPNFVGLNRDYFDRSHVVRYNMFNLHPIDYFDRSHVVRYNMFGVFHLPSTIWVLGENFRFEFK